MNHRVGFSCHGRYSDVTLEDATQFEEHLLMSGRSTGPAYFNRSEYRIDYEGSNNITWRLRPEWRCEDSTYLKGSVEIQSLAKQNRKLTQLSQVSQLEVVILIG